MKLFNLEEANALIPTVRPILTAIRKHSRTLQHLSAEVGAASESASSGGGLTRGGQQYCEAMLGLAARAAELEALGIQLKDYGRGLIDFPTLREGRIVLLCWHLGESERIEWWHELDAGFAGRQPI